MDTPSAIYTVEHQPVYEPILDIVWGAAEKVAAEVLASEFTLLETRVAPARNRDQALPEAYELLLHTSENRMSPIPQQILRRAIPSRAGLGLKMPGAICCATAS